MKKNIFKKSSEIKRNELIVLSKNDQKEIQGGGRMALVIDENGNYKWVCLP